MKNYSENYLKVVSKIYQPNQKTSLRYMRGEYMLNLKTKYGIVKDYGSDAAILYEFFHEKKRFNHFSPTNDTLIASELGWSKSKVTRIKSILKKANLLLILKDTVKDGTILFRIILNTDLIEHYQKHNVLPLDIEIHVEDISKKET